MHFYEQSSDEVLLVLKTNEHGLSVTEATKRLSANGPNSLKLKQRPLWRTLFEPFANIFMLVLIIAAIFSIAQGSVLDAVIIVVIMTISAVIYYVQYFSTEKILADLQTKSIQRVTVVRARKHQTVVATDLVVGDIVVLNEGEKIPADARIVHANSLRVDESLLTGESEPVSKSAHPLEGQREAYEQSNMLFQGSFIVSGDGLAVVVATGNHTQFGKIAALATGAGTESPVQKKIDSLLTQIVGVVIAVSAVALALSLYRNMELGEAVRFILTLAVSAVPEGLPVAITVILVLGMRRLAKRKALIRNMAAIETIGVITTIATDKTGTLTKNLLTVQEIWEPAHTNQPLAEILPFTVNESKGHLHDPLDIALSAYCKSRTLAVPKQNKLIATLPFDHRYAMSGNVWQHGSAFSVIVKGAPEHILERCGLTAVQKKQALAALHSLTTAGNRVIAVAALQRAHADVTLENMPNRLMFIGFVGVADVLRPEAKPAVIAAQAAGIQVQMITGDHFETAFRIAKQLGIAEHRTQVFDSRKLSDLTDKQLEKIVAETTVFARVVPEQKYRILTALKKVGIPAMTGDGVNDVPALANANVGIAMGSGSQIAKDAGDIILLDNNFKSIVEAMREGRIIFSNIRRMLFYLLTTTTGEVLTMIGALLIGLPIPVASVQILWINLVTDTALVIPLGLEAGEKHIMATKPRNPNAPILDRFLVTRLVVLAISMAIIALGVFAFFSQTYSVAYAQTITFTTLVVMQWANALNARREVLSIFARSGTVNKKFYVGLALAVSLQALALFGPLQSVLHVVAVAPLHLFATAAIASAIIIAISELHKYLGRRLSSATSA